MNHSSFFQILAGAVLTSTLAACGHPEQKFAVTVTDESGKPMSGIECKAWFKKPGGESAIQDYFVTEATDANGKVELAGETIWAPTSVEARKSGYYLSLAGKHWTERRNGKRWEPWPVELKLVMKKIRNPHPMYAVSCGSSSYFLFPKDIKGSIGFDLIEMDWVSPYGTGKISDFLLEGIQKSPENINSREGWIHLTFPNSEDGLQPVNSEGGSLLMGPHEAPEQGYLSEWKFPNYPTKAGESLNPVRSSLLHVFRVRTILDEEGKVISAHYGKIHNGIRYAFGPGGELFSTTYYLNGTPNDRNLEWDQETNLFKDLKGKGIPDRP